MTAMLARISSALLLLLGLLASALSQSAPVVAGTEAAAPVTAAAPVAAAAPVVAAAPAAPAAPVVAATPAAGAQAAAPVIDTGAAATASAAPGASACPQIAPFGPGTVIKLEDYSMQNKMALTEGNVSLGSISSPVYSYALENELKTTTGSLVAKLVSPTVFWDTTADMYDCVDDQIAEIKWSSENWWKRMFNPSLRIYEIFDASGNEVAVMENLERVAHAASFKVMALKVNGEIVMQINFEEKGFSESIFGLFGNFKKATISSLATTTSIPPLLKDPRFLSLVAAAELAHGNLGPFWRVFFWALPFACIICFCCNACCGKSKDKNSVRPVEVGSPVNRGSLEERSRLIGPGEAGMREAAQQAAKAPSQQQGGLAGFLNCCSRRGGPPAGGMAPV